MRHRLAAVLLVLVLAPACAAQPAQQAPPASPTGSASAPAQAPAAGPPSGATVARVVDGDTLELTDGRKVRLLGIDAPESKTCEGPPATEHMKALALDKTVMLTGTGTDRYGRLLRYVDLPDATDAGLAMIKAGHAKARYDSTDGYPRHPRQDVYHETDDKTPDLGCP